jgi:NAD(P)-dependent dehydrogenase (short-subunit alcohol dehydrogenase family)
MQPLRGQVAVVTGGARGLGRAYVLRLARLGAHVVIVDVDLDAASEFDEPLTAESVMAEAEAFDVQALGIQADVTDQAAVQALITQTLDVFGRVDILVNNAGGALRPVPNNSAVSEDAEHFQYIMDINLTGTIYCCQAAARPMMAARRGRIVNVASQAGLWSNRDGGVMSYKVAKAGVVQYTRILAAELGPYNVNVNSIAPGYILSSRAIAGGRDSGALKERLLAQIPLGRLGVPEDCAKVVEFLVTDLSDYVTGQCIPICGGYVAWQ